MKEAYRSRINHHIEKCLSGEITPSEAALEICVDSDLIDDTCILIAHENRENREVIV